LKEADEVLVKASKQEAAETRPKILEDGRAKLVILAEAMHTEAEDRTWEGAH
jgi:hypothetical protein